jgi:hypothetical protein
MKYATKPLRITLFSNFKRKVVRYGDKAVKSSPDILPSEAEAMRFIAANKSIPIPRVYEEGNEPVASITMDCIEGVGLDIVWNGLKLFGVGPVV